MGWVEDGMRRTPWLDSSTLALVLNSIEEVRVCFRGLQRYGRHALRWFDLYYLLLVVSMRVFMSYGSKEARHEVEEEGMMPSQHEILQFRQLYGFEV